MRAHSAQFKKFQVPRADVNIPHFCTGCHTHHRRPGNFTTTPSAKLEQIRHSAPLQTCRTSAPGATHTSHTGLENFANPPGAKFRKIHATRAHGQISRICPRLQEHSLFPKEPRKLLNLMRAHRHRCGIIACAHSAQFKKAQMMRGGANISRTGLHTHRRGLANFTTTQRQA